MARMSTSNLRLPITSTIFYWRIYPLAHRACNRTIGMASTSSGRATPNIEGGRRASRKEGDAHQAMRRSNSVAAAYFCDCCWRGLLLLCDTTVRLALRRAKVTARNISYCLRPINAASPGNLLCQHCALLRASHLILAAVAA